MNDIPAIGWFLIIGIGTMVLASYLTLFSMFKNKDKKNSDLSKMIDSARSPFAKSENDLSELSRRVRNLQKPPENDSVEKMEKV